MKTSWLAILLVVTALAYTGFFLSLSSEPFTDAPNHLARAAVMNSLWFDSHSPFQGRFSASRIFMPYMLPDLGLILVIQILGFSLACPVWSTLTMLSLVLAIWLYARQILTTSWAIAAAVLCSWYFATNYLFILGFFSFQWGVAAAFAALAALEGRRKKVYVVACIFCYGAHLASFAMLAAIAGTVSVVRALRKEQSWSRVAGDWLPFAALTAYHLFLVPVHPEAPSGAITRSTAWDKFGHFFESFFVRENYTIDRTILVFFWGIVLIAIWLGRRHLREQWELLTVCGVAATIYFVLPFGLAGVFYVDERALPFFFIPLSMLALRLFEKSAPDSDHVTRLLLACALLAAANLGSLAWFLPRQNRDAAQYREALLKIPAGKLVLPIQTRRRDGNTYPLRHAASFYVADRNGYEPYLFSQANASGPAGYFTDLLPIYRPQQNWYLGKTELDWEKVARSYDYVVISKPWRAGRIDFGKLELFYQNRVATVFRVRRAHNGGQVGNPPH
jgi:hypothetical protein